MWNCHACAVVAGSAMMWRRPEALGAAVAMMESGRVSAPPETSRLCHNRKT